MARAAAAANTVMVVSTMSSRSLEDVARRLPGAEVVPDLYCYREKGVTERLVKRAETAGYEALCLTVDVPRLGRRERDLRHNLRFPNDVVPRSFLQEVGIESIPGQSQGSMIAAYAASLIDPSLTWDIVTWLKSITSMPVVVKGILTAEDAVLAVERGVAVVIVSNHGGRQLDGVPAVIDVLPEIVAAVDRRCEVIVDGGIKRGTDVLKALALGARAVLIGRPYIWGLVVDGEPGVAGVLQMLREELELAMSLCGVTNVQAITPELVRR